MMMNADNECDHFLGKVPFIALPNYEADTSYTGK